MSDKKKKIVIYSVVATVMVAILAAAVVVTVTQLSGKTQHLQTEGIDMSLTRDKLTYNNLTDKGLFIPTTDNEKKDFTKPTNENIFGLTSSSTILPGCMYEAQMTVSPAKEDGKPFVYWLEFKSKGISNALSEIMQLTITLESGEQKVFKLSQSNFIGNEKEPLAIVESGKPSTFKVKLSFVNNNLTNNDAQGENISFDLVIHAAPLN